MKSHALLLSLALAPLSVFAADGPDAEAIKKAAAALKDASGYAWTSTTSMGENSRWQPGPTEGKANKDGWVHMTSTRGDQKTEMVWKDGRTAIKGAEGWRTPEEMAAAESSSGDGERRGRGGFAGRMARSFKTPADLATDLVGKAKSLTKDGDTISGDLTDEAVKELMTFGGRRRDGAEAPAPENAKGSVKFWLKDGALTKMEYHVEGTLSFNGNSMDLKRTTTTEIKDAGTASVEIPAEAKQKIESAPKPEASAESKPS
jgi:hypothetical protein